MGGGSSLLFWGHAKSTGILQLLGVDLLANCSVCLAVSCARPCYASTFRYWFSQVRRISPDTWDLPFPGLYYPAKNFLPVGGTFGKWESHPGCITFEVPEAGKSCFFLLPLIIWGRRALTPATCLLTLFFYLLASLQWCAAVISAGKIVSPKERQGYCCLNPTLISVDNMPQQLLFGCFPNCFLQWHHIVRNLASPSVAGYIPPSWVISGREYFLEWGVLTPWASSWS